MKKIKYWLVLIILLMPFISLAISPDYHDVISSLGGVSVEEDKINLYLFYGEECPHCEKEREWLEKIKITYKDYINIYEFEIWHNEDNREIVSEVRKHFSISGTGVPLTIVGEKYYSGFSDAIKSVMEGDLEKYLGFNNNSNYLDIPLLGHVNMKSVSIPLVAIVLGFIDGFNPCALWILLFLINMLFNVQNRKKAWILGITFLLVSALVYFLSMLGINFVLEIATINILKIAISILIIVAGIMNLKKYIMMRKEENGCHIVDSSKRKKIMDRMKRIMDSKSFLLAFLGIILLAGSVNLIEMACSLGFPLIFTEIITINEIQGITKIIYFLIYIIFYMLDDLIVFIISMVMVEATGITNKYNKLCTLVSAIIMIIMGLLLIFKPDWLMLNF